jgi:hypothetical protein
LPDKDFKVKNKLTIAGLTNSSGVLLVEGHTVDSHTNLATQFGGTGTTTSPTSGQFLYSSGGTTYAPTTLSSVVPVNLYQSSIPSSASNGQIWVDNDASALTVSEYLTPTIGSTAITSNTTISTIAGLTLSSPELTGTPLAVTADPDTNTSQIATTAFVMGQNYAPKSSPTFTGNLTVDTNTLFVDATNDRVGIGTTSFTIGSTINSNAKIHTVGGAIASMNYGTDLGISMGRANGTLSSPTQVLANERMSFVIGSGYFTGATNGFANTASVGFFATQNYTDTARGSSIQFETVLTGGTVRAARVFIDGSGHLNPSTTNTYDLGTSSLRWRNIYTQDLHLSNGIGDYTVVEGEENLYLTNNKNGKSYKFALIEVDSSEIPPKSEV